MNINCNVEANIASHDGLDISYFEYQNYGQSKISKMSDLSKISEIIKTLDVIFHMNKLFLWLLMKIFFYYGFKLFLLSKLMNKYVYKYIFIAILLQLFVEYTMKHKNHKQKQNTQVWSKIRVSTTTKWFCGFQSVCHSLNILVCNMEMGKRGCHKHKSEQKPVQNF